VVDDDDGVRETLADYLSLQGYGVRQASSGAELDAVLVAAEVDLVLIDVNMPGEDGFAIARRLRATLNIPVFMGTAVETVIDRVAGLEAGADDYLTKPFDLREVRSRIRAVLRRYSEATVRDTGRAFVNPEAHVWTIREGKLARFQSYHDTAAAAAAHRRNRRRGADIVGAAASRSERARSNPHAAGVPRHRVRVHVGGLLPRRAE
jgi:DNA-binding response OmpR family regulator